MITNKDLRAVIASISGIDFEEASKVAGFITPMPGRVGPMTIAMLMKNTLYSLKYKLGLL